MRQRKPKNFEERIKELEEYQIATPEDFKGRWASAFATHLDASDGFHENKRLYLEIGCGKGRFITENAKINDNDLYIGFEGQNTVILRALEKIRENSLNNVRLCNTFINDLSTVFDENELDGIYLNFSDPWPKDRHEKRRLSSDKYLDDYAVGIKYNGFIKMKTDNDKLFEYSIKQFENHPDFDIVECSRDLYNSKLIHDNIMTEYEKKFINLDKKINYIYLIRK